MKSAEPARSTQASNTRDLPRQREQKAYLCDRCGVWMVEWQCKAICPNCGGQMDCSDLTIHFDELDPARKKIAPAQAGGPDGRRG